MSLPLVPVIDHKGVVPICEILVGSPALANLIREGKTVQIPSLMQSGRGQGMMTMDTALQQALHQKLINPWDALEVATDKQAFVQFLSVEDRTRVPVALR